MKVVINMILNSQHILHQGKILVKRTKTNVFTQALRDALSDYNKYIKKSANDGVNKVEHNVAESASADVNTVANGHHAENGKEQLHDGIMMTEKEKKAVEEQTEKNAEKAEKAYGKELYPPMLAEPHDDIEIDFTKPTFIQRKFNGVRAVATLVNKPENADKKSVILYSRGLGIYPSDISTAGIEAELLEILRDHPDIYIDGEIYTHGVALQDISGMARGEKTLKIPKAKKTTDKPAKTATAKTTAKGKKTEQTATETSANARADESEVKPLNYQVFDLFNPKSPDMLFSERYELLKSLFAPFPSLKYVHLVETFTVSF